MKEKTGENIEKKYKSLIKKISDEDLRDILSITLCDPEIVSTNFILGELDIERFEKTEKEYHLNNNAKLMTFDIKRYENLRLILVKEFHIFDQDKFIDPVLGEAKIFPKVSLLVEIIKLTLNLRKTGKEFSDEQTIKLVECFTSDYSKNDYKIVINEDYNHPLNVSKSKNIWRMFIDLVQNGYLNRDIETKRIYDFLNYNPYNLITTNTKFPLQKIIGQRADNYVPLFKRAVHTEKALAQRQNKIKHST